MDVKLNLRAMLQQVRGPEARKEAADLLEAKVTKDLREVKINPQLRRLRGHQEAGRSARKGLLQVLMVASLPTRPD